MIQFDLPKEQSSIIKVIGVGGGGNNAVNHMHAQSIEGVNFIICNTDAQAIANSKVPNKIQLGPHLTQGLGAGANPEIGRQATEESLEEIRRILEVNTKMAFITAGMGGGTGTGGAPIIAKICKDLGILTVGIVTTPFSYEGKKRFQQASEGIERMKQYVDTLLVISNDKLRHQFGNLKMKEAFGKADNVLSTAARCITDVINTTGQINVDFADVCTVMRQGGVAILGNASAGGENRAQKAIEEALNSPLLNENDIRGAKWILININSAEGEFEHTMDEVEVIQQHLLEQAGADPAVILGMGYDASLGDKIGITLIATGFEKNEMLKSEREEIKKPEVESDKIILSLKPAEEPAFYAPQLLFKEEVIEPVVASVNNHQQPLTTLPEKEVTVFDEPVSIEAVNTVETEAVSDEPVVEWTLEMNTMEALTESVAEVPVSVIEENNSSASEITSEEESSTTSILQGFLAKPAVIYQETSLDEDETVEPATEQTVPSEEDIVLPSSSTSVVQFFTDEEDEIENDWQLIEKEELPSYEKTIVINDEDFSKPELTDNQITDESEEQRKKAADRLHKLRNLSFNYNTADPNNEFETVPAYVRRNLELYNTISPAENFYSNYTVQNDDENKVRINNLNSFLEGKKPD